MPTAAVKSRMPSAAATPHHESTGARAKTFGKQVPSRPGRVQVAFPPSHAVLQQTPCAHCIDRHCVALVQVSPSGRLGERVAVVVAAGAFVAVGVALGLALGGSTAVGENTAVGLNVGVSVGVLVRVAVCVLVEV